MSPRRSRRPRWPRACTRPRDAWPAHEGRPAARAKGAAPGATGRVRAPGPTRQTGAAARICRTVWTGFSGSDSRALRRCARALRRNSLVNRAERLSSVRKDVQGYARRDRQSRRLRPNPRRQVEGAKRRHDRVYLVGSGRRRRTCTRRCPGASGRRRHCRARSGSANASTTSPAARVRTIRSRPIANKAPADRSRRAANLAVRCEAHHFVEIRRAGRPGATVFRSASTNQTPPASVSNPNGGFPVSAAVCGRTARPCRYRRGTGGSRP